MTRPGEADWERWERLLAPLYGAGWEEIDEDTFGEWADDVGVVLCGTLVRTGVALSVEYHPDLHTLRIQPYEDVVGDAEFLLVVGDGTEIAVDQDDDAADHFAVLGLLDATRVELDGDSEVSLGRFVTEQFIDYVVGDAASHRGTALQTVAAEIEGDSYLPSFLTILRFSACTARRRSGGRDLGDRRLVLA